MSESIHVFDVTCAKHKNEACGPYRNKVAAKKNSHKCCAAALCTNRSDNHNNLPFHAFPTDESRRKEWRIRMKRQDDKFKTNTSLYCCGEHFNPDDYKGSFTGLRRDLKPNAVPSEFPWTKNKGSLSFERSQRLEHRSQMKDILVTKDNEGKLNEGSPDERQAYANAPSPCDTQEATLSIEELSELVEQLKFQVKISKFGIERFCGSDEDIFFYTGFPNYKTFTAFWEYVEPSAESLLTWKHARTKADNQSDRAFPYLNNEDRQRCKSRNVQPIDQLWMFLTRVRLGLFENDLAFRFLLALFQIF